MGTGLVPRSERRCDMCPTGAVGGEYHFVFVCPALAPVRARYAALFRPSFRTLRAFLWQEGILAVVRFVYDCFQVRSQLQTR